MDTTETVGPVPRETRESSRVIDIRKDHMTFVQVAADHPRACLNGMTRHDLPVPTGNQHLTIGDRLIRGLAEIFVVSQTYAISFGGASVAQVTK